MSTFFSQNGEDYLINKIFKGKTNGFYIEIGCLDGIEFSNTYFFEKLGWKGICVEAHNDFIELLKKNRIRSQIVHCAVGEKDQDDVVFYANKIGSLSTLDKTEETRWRKDFSQFFSGFEEQHVEMRTLNSICSRLNVNEIDFVSLDIEGYEVQALTGMDLNKYRPRVFIIEYKDENHKADLETILFKYNYKFLAFVGCNLVYGTEKSDAKILNKRHGKINLITFNKQGKEIVNEVDIDLSISIVDRLKSKLKKVNRQIKVFLGKQKMHQYR